MKRNFVLLFILLTVFFMGNWGRSVGGQKAPLSPSTDHHFCADANGDGRLDVSDAVRILNFLFVGSSTPYCVAQDISLDRFASREDLGALKTRVEALESRLATASLAATGSYTGDGKNRRPIETGLPGPVRFVQLWSRRADEKQ
jgi:hypothetical protein